MKSREVTFIVTALILGAVIGGLMGEIIAEFLPEGGVARDVLSRNIEIGFPATQVDLYAISFIVGLSVKINFMSVLVILLVIIYFRWWYL
jgi:hypothetical protein